jgi:hypothetical protein
MAFYALSAYINSERAKAFGPMCLFSFAGNMLKLSIMILRAGEI